MTDPTTLDRILELQFLVGWAGEGKTDPPRLGWWRTNWVDEYGGYDLLSRMLPRTAAWAQFELVREAARRIDSANLLEQADIKRIRTLFYLDPELDRALKKRLHEHKFEEKDPREVLPALRATHAWDADAFRGFLGDLGQSRTFVNEPFGKRLQGDAPSDPVALVRTLAQGLLPLGSEYPRPYALA